MYKIVLQNIENTYDFNELIKIFLEEEEYELYTESEFSEVKNDENFNSEDCVVIVAEGFSKNQLKQ